MSRLQTLRMIACMLLMGVVAIAAYLFYQHSLYFCLFFSLMITLDLHPRITDKIERINL